MIEFEIETPIKGEKILSQGKSIFIKDENRFFIVSVNHGYPCNFDTFNQFKYKSIINPSWNELVIFEVDKKENPCSSFLIKNPDINSKYFIDSEKIKFVRNEFLEINMLPNYPKLLYYVFQYNGKKELMCGSGIYSAKNKLVGIFAKQNDNLIYVIPSIYILKSIKKKTNDIYFPEFSELDKIKKINNYVIKNGKIFYRPIGILIPLSTYFVLEGEEDTKLDIILTTRNFIKTNFKPKNDFKIPLSNTINETVNTAFLNYLLLKEKYDLLNKIIFEEEDHSFSFFIKFLS